MTKEELKNQIIDIERGTRILAEGTHCDKKYVVARIMQKTYAIQREFERYIDVLEPLKSGPKANVPTITASDYYSDIIGLLQKKYQFDCNFVAEMLKRACDLLDKKQADKWQSPQAQEAILKYELAQGQYQSAKITIRDANNIDTHYLTFINGVLTDYIKEGKTAKCSCKHTTSKRWLYCPHCGKEIE